MPNIKLDDTNKFILVLNFKNQVFAKSNELKILFKRRTIKEKLNWKYYLYQCLFFLDDLDALEDNISSSLELSKYLE